MPETLTNEEIAKKLSDLQAANDKLSEDNKTISAENQKMLQALNTKTSIDVLPATKTAPKLPTQRVRVGQAEYAFQVPVFYLNGFYYTAEEIVADQGSEDAQKIFGDLLKVEGQGILKIIK